VVQQPSLVLSAEAELGITAGLQDRVIQVCQDTAGEALRSWALAQP
jgi:hypothetical protein